MAKGFAIHNAPTNHGGIVPSTQMSNSQQGNLFVRAGDGHFCPQCKCWSTVIKSHDHVIMDGKPVAYAGDKLTCGATIQPQQSHVVGDSGSYYNRPIDNGQNLVSSQNEKFDEQLKIIFDNEIDDLFKNLDYKVKVGENIQQGSLDLNGKTSRFFTEKQESITEIELIFKEKIVYFHDL